MKRKKCSSLSALFGGGFDYGRIAQEVEGADEEFRGRRLDEIGPGVELPRSLAIAFFRRGCENEDGYFF